LGSGQGPIRRQLTVSDTCPNSEKNGLYFLSTTGIKFAQQGLQIAAGVPLQCDEPDDFRTFRLGLFGLDKLHDIERSVASLDKALSRIL
jgi:aspartate aminotransferase-like enzyme